MKKGNEKLIFGDLLETFDITFPESTLNEISAFYGDFINLKTSLLEAFIAFVISNKGFTYDTHDSIEDFDEDEWIEAFSGLPIQGPHFQAPDPFLKKWDIEFVKDGQKLVVTVLSGFPTGSTSVKDGQTYTLGENLAGQYDQSKRNNVKRIFIATNKSIYTEAKDQLKNLTQNNPMLHANELVNRFTEAEKERKKIKKTWKNIRDELLKEFEKGHPVLRRAKKGKGSPFYTAEDLINREKRNFEEGITNNMSIFANLRRALIKKLKKRFEIHMNKDVSIGRLFGTAREQLKRSRYDNYFDDVKTYFMKSRNNTMYNDNPVKNKTVGKAITAVRNFCEKIEDMEFYEDKVRREIIQTPPVSKGDTREVKIEDKGDKGDGIARIGGTDFIVMVPNTALEEKVKIEITEVKPTFAFGKRVES